jgi:hypothetical protein
LMVGFANAKWVPAVDPVFNTGVGIVADGFALRHNKLSVARY